jgi:cyclophilin family peptidyl-prolyl cis-trans isomerase
MNTKGEGFYLFVGLISGFILFFGLVFGLSVYAGTQKQDLNDLNDLEETQQQEQENTEDEPTNEDNTEQDPQPEPETITVPEEIQDKFKVEVVTQQDDEQLSFVIELDAEVAPRFANNFKNKAFSDFYSGLRWHRAEPFVLQGGDPLSADPENQPRWGTGGGSLSTQDQYSDREFIRGAVGIPRRDDKGISNDSQIFIAREDMPQWNGEYVYIGKVVEGIEVIDNLRVGDVIVGAEFVE